MEEKFWEELRGEFPITQNIAYFNSAGMSPIPNKVLNSITRAYQNLNLYGDMYFMGDLQTGEALREKLANIINAKASDISYAHNSSTAFSFIAAALKHSTPFDFNLISLLDEFPSTNIPFDFQGIPIKYVEPVNGVYTIESILEAIDEKTMGVVCSHVQYASGFRLDIEKLGNALLEMDVLFMVNATQSFPFFEIDVRKYNIDVLTASFHKWGLSGITGAMLFTSESFRKMYPNPMAGWLSVEPPSDDFIPTQKNQIYEQYEHAGQYNFGTFNFQALTGLDTAIDFIEEIGRHRIRNRITALIDYLIDGLQELPVKIVSPVKKYEYRSAIVLIDLQKGNNSEAVDFLAKRKIITCIRAGNIRISCNIFNNPGEIDQLLETLALFCEMNQ